MMEKKNNRRFGKAIKSDLNAIDNQGFGHWGHGLDFSEYCAENREEERRGTRYVLRNEQNEVLSSLILFPIQLGDKEAYGMASVLTSEEHRKKGHAYNLIQSTITEVQKTDKEAVLMCYSDIGIPFYELLGFRILPKELQLYPVRPRLVYCSYVQWEYFKNLSTNQFPKYF